MAKRHAGTYPAGKCTVLVHNAASLENRTARADGGLRLRGRRHQGRAHGVLQGARRGRRRALSQDAGCEPQCHLSADDVAELAAYPPSRSRERARRDRWPSSRARWGTTSSSGAPAPCCDPAGGSGRSRPLMRAIGWTVRGGRRSRRRGPRAFGREQAFWEALANSVAGIGICEQLSARFSAATPAA